jgi:xylan 1,4-beta-xylosidase
MNSQHLKNVVIKFLCFAVCSVLVITISYATGVASAAAKRDEQVKTVIQQSDEPVKIVVDATFSGKPLRHVWQYYGYDECNYTTTPHARELMKTLAGINAAPVYLRQHYLLVTGDGKPVLKWGSSNVYTEDAAGKARYDWRIMDGIMDAVIGSGCRPLVEIGFMPKALSVKPEPYENPRSFSKVGAGVSYPPNDYNRWAELIREWARHSKQRYNKVAETWLWELWNEPDIFYWRGSLEEYCKLFDYTEDALHEVMPKAILGGPHVANAGSAFFRRFLEHCASGKNAVTGRRGTRLDCIGFHSKGSTKLVNGHPQLNMGRNLSNIERGFSLVASFPEFSHTPIIIGECDPEGMAARSSRVHPANGYRNGSPYAAYEVALMKHTLDLAALRGINLQGVLTWAFMFDGKDYFEGFRTLSTNGIHKPVLNAFKMLGMLQGKRIPTVSSGSLGLAHILEKSIREKPDIDGLATATDETVQVLVWNYHDDIIPAVSTAVRLTIRAPKDAHLRARVNHYRIDETHSNAYTQWLERNSPQQPTPALLAELHAAAELEMLEPVRFYDVCNGEVQLNFSLPRYAVSFIELRWWP